MEVGGWGGGRYVFKNKHSYADTDIKKELHAGTTSFAYNACDGAQVFFINKLYTQELCHAFPKIYFLNFDFFLLF